MAVIVIIYKLVLHTYRVMYAYIFHLWYSGPRPSSKLLEDDWHCKCLFLPPPLVFEVLSFPHPLLFPLSAPPSRAFCCRFPLPLLQFKLKTGIMREVMGRRQQRGKSKSAAWQSSVLVKVRGKTISKNIQVHAHCSRAGAGTAWQVAQNMGALTG